MGAAVRNIRTHKSGNGIRIDHDKSLLRGVPRDTGERGREDPEFYISRCVLVYLV